MLPACMRQMSVPEPDIVVQISGLLGRYLSAGAVTSIAYPGAMSADCARTSPCGRRMVRTSESNTGGTHSVGARGEVGLGCGPAEPGDGHCRSLCACSEGGSVSFYPVCCGAVLGCQGTVTREDRHEVGLHGARWAGFISWGHRRPEAGGGPLNTRSTGCASSFGLFDTKVNM